MNKNTIKKLALILGVITLISNGAPLFAQVIELQILGGGYKLRGPTEINFSPVSTSAFPSTQQSNLRDILLEKTGAGTNLYGMQVIDENGGNPFDVTVTASEMKRSENLETTTITGTLDHTLKVTSSAGFVSGDTIIISGYFDNAIFTISSITDATTIELVESLGLVVPADVTVSRIVDCNLSPKKCIPLNNLSIRNYDDNGNTIDVINGNESDLILNAQTNDYFSFKGDTTTINGSAGSLLKVNDSSTFLPNESVIFANDSGVDPLVNHIISIDDNNTITLQTPFTTAPGSDIDVQSLSPRTLTLVNGTGKAPGQFEIYPSLNEVVPAGQMPGLYESTLNFTIV